MSKQITIKDLYPRRCSATGKGMNEGYCFHEGGYYTCDETTAKAYVESLGYNWEEELKTVNTDDEWFYWTEWDELDDDENFDIEGTIYSKNSEGEWEIVMEVQYLEFTDEGDGVEYEIWEDSRTKKKYRVPIEIIRDFDGVEKAE